jgi:hypothetical protein
MDYVLALAIEGVDNELTGSTCATGTSLRLTRELTNSTPIPQLPAYSRSCVLAQRAVGLAGMLAKLALENIHLDAPPCSHGQ